MGFPGLGSSLGKYGHKLNIESDQEKKSKISSSHWGGFSEPCRKAPSHEKRKQFPLNESPKRARQTLLESGGNFLLKREDQMNDSIDAFLRLAENELTLPFIDSSVFKCFSSIRKLIRIQMIPENLVECWIIFVYSAWVLSPFFSVHRTRTSHFFMWERGGGRFGESSSAWRKKQLKQWCIFWHFLDSSWQVPNDFRLVP